MIVSTLENCAAQEIDALVPAIDNQKKLQPYLDIELERDINDDKWALTDEDRMTDKEMDEELFGTRSPKVKSSTEEDEGGEEDVNDRYGNQDASKDGQSSAKEKTNQTIPKRTIESYLRNINALTIETYTPPADSLDGIDVPMRLMPPQALSKAKSHAVARLQFQTPDIYHQPLYFEDQNLERYGVHRCRRQPIESARRFMSDTVTLPIKIRQQPPSSCVHRENHRYNQAGLLPANR